MGNATAPENMPTLINATARMALVDTLADSGTLDYRVVEAKAELRFKELAGRHPNDDEAAQILDAATGKESLYGDATESYRREGQEFERLMNVADSATPQALQEQALRVRSAQRLNEHERYIAHRLIPLPTQDAPGQGR